MAIDIPTLDDATAAAQRNPLQQFVFLWSPALREHSERWREELAAAVDYAVQQELAKRTGNPDKID
jgi:hypothetical protein